MSTTYDIRALSVAPASPIRVIPNLLAAGIHTFRAMTCQSANRSRNTSAAIDRQTLRDIGMNRPQTMVMKFSGATATSASNRTR